MGFFKVNNNQRKDLEHNQIMRCIIYNNNFIGLEILAMCTTCRKGLIAYHKFNGITNMKKYVEGDHYSLVKRLTKYISYIIVAKAPINQNASKKKAHNFPFEIFG
jgi:hypothetical protein